MNFPEMVGNRIRELRKAKGWTQEDLAEMASMHNSYIGGVERGDRNISLETLERIIGALQVPAKEVFRFEEDSDQRRLADEHMVLIHSRKPNEIATLTRIVKEVISAIDASRDEPAERD